MRDLIFFGLVVTLIALSFLSVAWCEHKACKPEEKT